MEGLYRKLEMLDRMKKGCKVFYNGEITFGREEGKYVSYFTPEEDVTDLVEKLVMDCKKIVRENDRLNGENKRLKKELDSTIN